MLGLDDLPADLAGYGPITSRNGLRLTTQASSNWRRLITDRRTGACLDYERQVYEPPADLREFILARDSTCAFPNCEQPAVACQLDHIEDWAKGGHTSAINLAPLCLRHHRLKHQAGWSYISDAKDPGATPGPAHRPDLLPRTLRYTEPRPNPNDITWTLSDQVRPLVTPDPPEPTKSVAQNDPDLPPF